MGVVEDLRPIFSPKSIAVVGASRSPMKIGYEILQNILVHGYAGVDDMLVWDMVETRLADLRREVEELLGAG